MEWPKETVPVVIKMHDYNALSVMLYFCWESLVRFELYTRLCTHEVYVCKHASPWKVWCKDALEGQAKRKSHGDFIDFLYMYVYIYMKFCLLEGEVPMDESIILTFPGHCWTIQPLAKEASLTQAGFFPCQLSTHSSRANFTLKSLLLLLLPADSWLGRNILVLWGI